MSNFIKLLCVVIGCPIISIAVSFICAFFDVTSYTIGFGAGSFSSLWIFFIIMR